MYSLKLKQFFFLCMGAALLWASSLQWSWAAEPGPLTNRFSYSVFLDETREMEIDSIQKASFVPLDDRNRLAFSRNDVWLKIEALGVEKDPKDWYLKILPAFIIEATIFKPDEFNPHQWGSQTYSAKALGTPLLLGSMPSNGSIYLRLHSQLDFRLNVLVAEKEEIDLIQRRIDMLVVMISTMAMLTALFATIRILFRFNWVSVGLLLISVAIATSWIDTMGVLPFFTGIDQARSNQFFPVSMIGGMFSFLLIWMCLASQLFKEGRWIKYLWIIVVLLAALLVLAFFEPALAWDLVEVIYKLGQWVCLATLIAQAFVSRDQLRLRSEKVMFAMLLVFVLMPFPRATGLFKPFISNFATDDTPLLVGVMFFRSLVPLAALFLTAWTYDLLVSQRVKSIQAKLALTKDALTQESDRLKQQKQFIAMLTHELKNPLMASAMALSSIRQRLGQDDQTLQRVNSISHSLDEIDGIIERCSEIDKYEQGYIPVTLEPFPLGVIMSVVKNTQTSERIYTIVRGCDENQLVRTDIYYVKAILGNLLNNAIKYAVPESLVEFKVESVRLDGNTDIVFTVTNEVPPEGAPNPEMLFQRYYRAEMAKQQSGAGLGLWLAQSMAHALGTEIEYAIQQNNVTFQFAIRV